MNKATDVLKKSRLKATALRIELLHSVMHSDKALSHADLAGRIKEKVDRVSIYRNLITLTDAEIIKKIVDQTGTARYIFNAHRTLEEEIIKHPHFKCTRCDMVFCLPDLPTDYLDKLNILKIKNVSFLAEGICDNCS